MRWLKNGILLGRGPRGGGGLLWNERDLQEARITVGVRDYVSRAEGPYVEVVRAVQALPELSRDPALRLDAIGRRSLSECEEQTRPSLLTQKKLAQGDTDTGESLHATTLLQS